MGRVIGSVKTYTGGPVGCNGYLVQGPEGFVAVDAPLGMARWVATQLPEGGKLTHLLLTHQHFDHVDDVAAMQERFGCRVVGMQAYSRALTLEESAGNWGLPPVKPYTVDEVLGGSVFDAVWGGMAWEAYAIPGHSPDGAAYYLKEAECVWVGDILFAGSVGRTDFPGGSMSTLVRGIREKLLKLSPHTEVYSGHGPSTCIGEEMLNNPYIA